MDDNQELKDLLHELGYDEWNYEESDGLKFNRFMRQQQREVIREARSYLADIWDCDDDELIRLKNNTYGNVVQKF
jgi:hypothetical protein